MKTSIKLLIGLALGLVASMFGAAISIRQQFDKMDKSDVYSRWQQKQLPPFQAVHITGPSAAIVQIEPGTATRLLADSLNDRKKTTYTYKVERDTLFLHLNPMEDWDFNVRDESHDWYLPQIVVQSPTLTSVSTTDANCQIHYIKGDVLTLSQRGRGGSVAIENMQLRQLAASLSARSQLTLYGINNKIKQGVITVRDSARLFQYTDFTQGLTIKADPTAQLQLTGKALQQIQQ